MMMKIAKEVLKERRVKGGSRRGGAGKEALEVVAGSGEKNVEKIWRKRKRSMWRKESGDENS